MFYRIYSLGSYETIMPFNLITETEKSSKKTPSKHDIRHPPVLYKDLLFRRCLEALFTILGVIILKNYEFNMKEQLERAEPYR